jgi:tetratricopeptide (TPR) repeat protein
MNNIQEKIILNNHIDSLCDLYVKGRFYTIIQIAKKLLLRYKDSVALLNILGMSNAKINKYEDAIINYKKAIELSPDNATTFFHLGILYHDLNQYSEAIKSYKKAISINPLYVDAIFNIAYAYIDLEDNISAIEYLNKLKNIQHSNLSILLKVIFLCKFQEIADYKLLYNKYCSILNKEEKTKKFINYKNQISVTTLIGFGRSGSLFLHSLLDGHPQISTLPGYFFKGWFGEETWPIFQPNFQEINWRETLVEKICTYFEPQFNAHCKKNVIGEPNGNTKWFAKNLGFTQLGDNHSEVLKLDQQKFKRKFIDLSQAYDKIDSRICFELIHESFDQAYRFSENSAQKDKTIFYHFHNPNYYELSNFVCNYPSAKFLYVIRNPIQMLESWIAGYMNKINKTTDSFQNKIWFNLVVKRVTRVFHYMYDPFNDLFETRGVKLEDIKRNYQDLIPNLKNWIGVDYHTALEKSEFLNSKFSRPSASMDMISGFDTRSIDIKIGRFFSNRDIEILETLFWPFMKLYGYTEVSEKDFHQNLKKIKPLINEPLDIEVNYFSNFENNNINIKETSSFKLLHQNLMNAWNTLDQNMTYPYLIKKL